MNNEPYIDFQYDRCSSRGICSINPATASLLEIILLYLKHTAYYELKLREHGKKNKKIKNLILNTISVLSSNYEISEDNFRMIISSFKNELPEIIRNFEKACPDENKLDTEKLMNSCNYINECKKLGEKEFNKRVQGMEHNIRNMYKMLFVLVKSLCVNISTFESYGFEADEEILTVYKILNSLNAYSQEKSELKKIILNIAKTDCELMKKIRHVQEEKYGQQSEQMVSFSTTKGKAILVVGSSLRELEQILEEFKDQNIDIYTHDNMILAHTFPKFKEYEHLKGQFGQGMENCLLDFSTFPGPIILTKHSLFNVESLYRGRLFSTDFAYSKGVIPIKNNDFSEVLKSAQESKGFKNGKICEPASIGFSFSQTMEKINKTLSEKNFDKIVIFGFSGYSTEEKEYSETFLKHVPDNILVICMSCCEQKENVICLNSVGDSNAMLQISETIINETKLPVSIFFPHTDRHSLSLILNLCTCNNCHIYIGKWNHTVINPVIIEKLKNEFGILEITTPKKDLENILR